MASATAPAASRRAVLPTAAGLAVAIGLALPALGGAGLARAALALGLAALAAGWTTRLARRQIGGHTGDVAGACQQLCEVALLLGLLVGGPMRLAGGMSSASSPCIGLCTLEPADAACASAAAATSTRSRPGAASARRSGAASSALLPGTAGRLSKIACWTARPRRPSDWSRRRPGRRAAAMDRAPVDWSELTASDWTKIIVYGTFATCVATAIPGLFRGRILAGLVSLGLWAALLFVALAGYAYRFELGTVAERVMAVLVPGTVIESGPQGGDGVPAAGRRLHARQQRRQDPGGLHARHRRLVGRAALGGRAPAEDPGALARLRRRGHDRQRPRARRRGRCCPSLSIGPLTQTNVKALVEKPGALHENLLGMSYLNKLESFTVSNDKLVLRGR